MEEKVRKVFPTIQHQRTCYALKTISNQGLRGYQHWLGLDPKGFRIDVERIGFILEAQRTLNLRDMMV